MVERFKEKGFHVNPTHSFELLKVHRLQMYKEIWRPKFIRERALNHLETTEEDLKGYYLHWLKREASITLPKWLENSKTASEAIELQKYKDFVLSEIDQSEGKRLDKGEGYVLISSKDRPFPASTRRPHHFDKYDGLSGNEFNYHGRQAILIAMGAAIGTVKETFICFLQDTELEPDKAVRMYHESRAFCVAEIKKKYDYRWLWYDCQNLFGDGGWYDGYSTFEAHLTANDDKLDNVLSALTYRSSLDTISKVYELVHDVFAFFLMIRKLDEWKQINNEDNSQPPAPKVQSSEPGPAVEPATDDTHGKEQPDPVVKKLKRKPPVREEKEEEKRNRIWSLIQEEGLEGDFIREPSQLMRKIRSGEIKVNLENPHDQLLKKKKAITPKLKEDPTFEDIFRGSDKARKLIQLLKQKEYINDNEKWLSYKNHIVPLYGAIVEHKGLINVTKRTTLGRIFCKRFGIEPLKDRTARDFNSNRELFDEFAAILAQL